MRGETAETFAVAAPATPTWIELQPTGAAPPHLHTPKSVFYDAANNRLVAFFPGSPIINPYGNEVWVITHANGLGDTPEWIRLLPAGTPPRSNGLESVVYDAIQNRLTVYGGCAANCSPALSDVYVPTNANGLGGVPEWIDSSVTNPQARAYHSAVYDSDSNRMIAFGGNDAFFGTDHNDTRVLSNANGLATPSAWTTLQTSGGPPGIRNSHTAVYDEVGRNMVVFGGSNYIRSFPSYVISDYNDTWMLSDADGLSSTPLWTQMAPVGALPSVRGGHSAVYAPGKDRMIVFGGSQWQQANQTSTTLGDLWELRNATGTGGAPEWVELAQSGQAPGARSGHGAAWDEANQRMMVLSGADINGQVSHRLWVLSRNDSPPDNQPPVAQCRDVTVVANGSCQADASANNGSFDPDGDPIALSQSPAGPYGSGNTDVTLTVTDDQGASASCTWVVTVVDTTAPVIISSVSVTPCTLWPPNHKMVPVTVSVAPSDNCSRSPICKIISVASNEPVNGTGDGDRAPDLEITGNLTAKLRAERAGNGTGRVYTLAGQCVDTVGNSASWNTTVHVPHDQRKR